MSESELPHSLSDAASSVVCRIPELLRRLRDLENEEAELDAKARRLVEEPPMARTKGRPLTPFHSTISSPVSILRSRATDNEATPSTPSCIDPEGIETPVKSFLLMQSFALAMSMSIKSKRKGRIFMHGGSTEFGERR